ncbi:MAG: DUF1127 domain-containing protein [Alphaproteobacteria bacterium]|nr:DUF1127 domain-containing protein [Alphaproteobacteria bacterium]
MERKARQERAAIVGGWIRERLARAIASLRAAHRRRVAMAELNALDNRMLADIGISRSEISGVVASASGYTPRTVRTPAAASSLNDDALSHAA